VEAFEGLLVAVELTVDLVRFLGGSGQGVTALVAYDVIAAALTVTDDPTSAESAPDAKQLRETLARLESLTELAFALSGAVTQGEVASLVVEQGMREARADMATLYVLDDSGEGLDLLAQRGVSPDVLQRIVRITKTEGNPRVMETLATGVSVWAETEAEYAAIYPEVARLPASGRRAKAFWSVPLIVEGRPVGFLGMGFFAEQRFSAEDRRFVETFTKLCAQALLRAVRRDRDVALERRAEKRRAFLARAMETLASSLDYRTTLQRVAELAVPELADWCTIDILESSAEVSQQVAVAHVDPAKVAFAREVGERYPSNRAAQTGAPQVIRSGKSELYPELPAALIERAARDADHLRILRELKLESCMIVALRSDAGRTLGALTFVYADSGRRYNEDDLSFAEDFARRAALAIENARAASEVEAARAREQAMRERAEQASMTKDHFLATVSHELRTPLNVILGWTVVLRERERELAPEVQRALAVIERNARAQARLIEDVLDLSRISSGKLSLALASVNVGEAVRAAALALRPAAEGKGVALTFYGHDDDALLTISADADRLQQILWNLLSNALKFTPKGGSIGILATRVGSEVQIQVADTGEGIAENVLPHVFEPFRQADSSTTRRHGGLGLGLSLVRQITAAHGGTVEANSDGPGRGATFVVRLPARAVTEAVKTSRPARKPTRFGTGALGLLSGVSVLVVDDELDARELVAEAFKSAGAIVYMAASARDALGVIASALPDVLVSDIGMPFEDGYTLMQQVRELPAERGGEIPALALTAYARAADADRAYDAGYQRHVAKPVDPLLLVQLVAGLTGRSTPVPRS
jgi:signal transduction histidine kinase/CheY-like chemotaxis protein